MQTFDYRSISKHTNFIQFERTKHCKKSISMKKGRRVHESMIENLIKIKGIPPNKIIIGMSKFSGIEFQFLRVASACLAIQRAYVFDYESFNSIIKRANALSAFDRVKNFSDEFQSKSSIEKQIRFAMNCNLGGILIFAGNIYDLDYYQVKRPSYFEILKCLNDLSNRNVLNYSIAETVNTSISTIMLHAQNSV